MAGIWRKAAAAVARRAGIELEDGQGLAEYALILMFVALACVAALGALGTAIKNSPGWTIP
jgi:hypothetical protein